MTHHLFVPTLTVSGTGGYEYTISFHTTAAHSNADALSRLPVQYQEEKVPSSQNYCIRPNAC